MNQLMEQNEKMAEAEERRSQAQVQSEKEAKETSERHQKELNSLQEKIKLLVRGLHHIFYFSSLTWVQTIYSVASTVYFYTYYCDLLIYSHSCHSKLYGFLLWMF